MLSGEEITSLFSYDARTGTVTRLSTGTTGTKSTQGYIVFNVSGKVFRAHRIAWIIQFGEWPANEVDHINGDRSDNRLENLRVVTHKQNLANAKLRSTNKSGFKGVSYSKGCRKWVATIFIDGKSRYLGVYSTPEEAHSVYMEVLREAFGEFARAA